MLNLLCHWRVCAFIFWVARMINIHLYKKEKSIKWKWHTKGETLLRNCKKCFIRWFLSSSSTLKPYPFYLGLAWWALLPLNHICSHVFSNSKPFHLFLTNLLRVSEHLPLLQFHEHVNLQYVLEGQFWVFCIHFLRVLLLLLVSPNIQLHIANKV